MTTVLIYMYYLGTSGAEKTIRTSFRKFKTLFHPSSSDYEKRFFGCSSRFLLPDYYLKQETFSDRYRPSFYKN
jgi:hypothetical protein